MSFQKREFIYGKDITDAYVFLSENVKAGNKQLVKTNNKEKPTNYQLPTTHYNLPTTHFINIGTGKDISIKELATTIKEIVGYRGELYFNTDKPDGTMIKLTDPSKLHKLGWKHKVELEEGIKRVYEWYLNEK